MSTFAFTADRAVPRTPARGILARLCAWCSPANSNLAWTIGPDGLLYAQWIAPSDADGPQ